MAEKHRTNLSQILGQPITQISLTPVSGGCISQAFRVTIRPDSSVKSESAGQTLFAKANSIDFLDNFRAETRGLELLGTTAIIRVPRPQTAQAINGHAYLLLDWIEPSSHRTSNSNQFHERFGQQLAELHRATSGRQIGLDHDNYLGAAKQINSPESSWHQFFAKHRLGFQLQWGLTQHLITNELRILVEKIIDSLPKILAANDSTTSLLHGDLWSGNYLMDQQGEPVLIDPAVYRGHREAEFGMLKLFGGCPQCFYDAYEEAWPLEAGWQTRSQVYVFYHLLNHLNLFGQGYLGDCVRLGQSILQTA